MKSVVIVSKKAKGGNSSDYNSAVQLVATGGCGHKKSLWA